MHETEIMSKIGDRLSLGILEIILRKLN